MYSGHSCPLEEGYHMVRELKANGNPVTYWEIEGGDHGLTNQANRWDMIADWLEMDSQPIDHR